MPFTPGPPLQVDDEKLQAIINVLWTKLQEIAEETNFILFPEIHIEPYSPQVGLTVYADGSDWNPGSGAGLYRWSGSAWVKI